MFQERFAWFLWLLLWNQWHIEKNTPVFFFPVSVTQPRALSSYVYRAAGGRSIVSLRGALICGLLIAPVRVLLHGFIGLCFAICRDVLDSVETQSSARASIRQLVERRKKKPVTSAFGAWKKWREGGVSEFYWGKDGQKEQFIELFIDFMIKCLSFGANIWDVNCLCGFLLFFSSYQSEILIGVDTKQRNLE